MHVFNGSPFSVERLIAMDGRGFEQLLVLLKATYDLTDFEGRVPRVAAQQDPLRLADEYRAEPGASSLLHASESAIFKPGADVMLQGHAFAKKVGDTAVNVAISVGAMKKSVRVWGDRVWNHGVADLVPSSPAPFVKIPLVFERAFGGTDEGDPDRIRIERCPQNPVGMGFRGKKNPLNFRGLAVPNLEDPKHPVEHPGRAGMPCCLGPVAPHWEPRASLAGTYDDSWMETRMPLLPNDFNPRYYHAVTSDQIIASYIQGGEPVAVVGATPSGTLGFSVPKVSPQLVVRIADEDRPLRPLCDTLVVDTDRMVLTLLWRASTPIHGRVPEFEWLRVGADV